MLMTVNPQEIMNGKPGDSYIGHAYYKDELIVLLDTMKGSYYANPVLDEPNVSAQLREAYPEYYGKNICKSS